MIEHARQNNQLSHLKLGVAALIIGRIDNSKNVLLLLRNKEPETGCWAIPGGKLKTYETFEMAIRREVREELGLEINIEGLLTITRPIDSIDGTEWFSPVFLVKKFKGEPKNLEPLSHQRLQWFPIGEAPTNLNTTTRIAIEQYLAEHLEKEFL